MTHEYINELNKATAPFVYAWFTLSTHMPYDFEGEKKNLTNIENDYTNSVVYADRALRSFFSQAQKQPWYNNTLFVITSDHSHGCHRDFSVYSPDYHQTPLVFFGNVIDSAHRSLEITHTASQLDIVKAILKQMHLNIIKMMSMRKLLSLFFLRLLTFLNRSCSFDNFSLFSVSL